MKITNPIDKISPILIFSSILIFTLGQLGRISFYGQQINIYLYEFILFISLIIMVIRQGIGPFKNSFRKFKIIYIFFVYLNLTFLFAIPEFSILENLTSYLYLIRLVLYGLFGIYFSDFLKTYRQNQVFARNILLIMIPAIILISLIQYFFYPDLRNLIYDGWDPHLYRMFGTFFDTSIAGAVYGILLIFVLTAKAKFFKNVIFFKSLIGLLLLFCVLTFSRNLYLSLIITGLFFLIKKKNYKSLITFFLIFALLIIISPKPFGEGVNLVRTYTFKSRIADYHNAVKIWKKNIISGIGYNRIRYEKVRMNIIDSYNSENTHSGASFHSSYLIILTTGGIIGLVLFTLVLVVLYGLNGFSKPALLFLTLMSFGDNIILHPFIIYLILLLNTVFNISLSHKQP